MKKIKNTKIGKKLTALKVEDKLKKTLKVMNFFTVVSIIVSMIGLMTTLFNLSKMYNVPFNVSVKSSEICNELNSIGQDLNSAILFESYGSVEKRVAESKESIEEAVSIIEPIFLGDNIIIDDLKKSIENMFLTVDVITSYLENNQFQEAKKAIIDTFSESHQNSYEKALKVKESSLIRSRSFTLQSEIEVVICVTILIIVLILSTISRKKIAREITSQIVTPLNALKTNMNELANGNLEVVIPEEILNSEDEFGDAARLFKDTTESLKKYISSISTSLEELANKNLDIENEMTYEGDFVKIGEAILNIVEFLNITISEIKITSNEVNGGATQVATASQNLSYGVTNQLGSIQEVTASIEEINIQVQEAAQNSNETKEVTKNLVVAIDDSNNKMSEMLKAMEDIKKSSNEINNIIETIDGIAEQTNLLALNAAIESARAGEVGRGFAVVSDEIRQLADETSKAVKKTADLIGQSIKAVESGKSLAEETAKSLNSVVSYVEEADKYVGNIAMAAEDQANAIEEINAEIEQISQVIQSTTEIAEESASASEDLTNQSEVLSNMINEFKLK